MAKDRAGLDLYEILQKRQDKDAPLRPLRPPASKLTDVPSAPEAEAPETELPALPARKSRAYTSWEIVLSAEVAFLILLFFLALTACAFLLGRRAGEERASGAGAPADPSDIPMVSVENLGLVRETPLRRAVAQLGAADWTLKLVTVSPREDWPLARLHEWEKDIRARARQMLKRDMDTYIFEEGPDGPNRTGGAYTLTLGQFPDESHPDLRALADYFKGLEGPPVALAARPYESSAPCSRRMLGREVR